MRSRAAESNLVVVNHHLLCADAAVRQSAYGEVIPECSYAIVDEAHQLEDVATQYFGVSVSTYRFDELARDGERADRGRRRRREGAGAARGARPRARSRPRFLPQRRQQRSRRARSRPPRTACASRRRRSSRSTRTPRS